MRYEWKKTNKKALYSGCYLPFETAPPASQCTRLNNLSCQPRNCFAICKRHWFCFKTFKMMVCFITWANTGSGTSLYFPWNILHMPAMIALEKKTKKGCSCLPACRNMKNVAVKSKWGTECKADGVFFIFCHRYWWCPTELHWTSFPQLLNRRQDRERTAV